MISAWVAGGLNHGRLGKRGRGDRTAKYAEELAIYWSWAIEPPPWSTWNSLENGGTAMAAKDAKEWPMGGSSPRQGSEWEI